jgi:predicted nuclease of predicted toxin-antitoxin system
MKLLLDESIPRQLARFFPGTFEVHTVVQMGWGGTSNGALLQLGADHGFEAFVTADRGIAHQQNPSNLPLIVVVMVAGRTRVQELQPLVPRVVELLLRRPSTGVYHVAV